MSVADVEQAVLEVMETVEQADYALLTVAATSRFWESLFGQHAGYARFAYNCWDGGAAETASSGKADDRLVTKATVFEVKTRSSRGPLLTMPLSMAKSFRIHAVRATFLDLPAASNR